VTEGVLVVLAGTSGAGKGTIGRRLLERYPEMKWSVSWSSRPARPGEVEGVDYHFVSREEFERLRDAGGFLEWFEVYGDLKGTPRQFVVDEIAAGHDVLLELDVHGSLAVREARPRALLVFVQTPSREEQRRRLEERGADDPAAMERRLARAEAEERLAAEKFDAVIVNDDIGRAVDELAAIVEARRNGSR
jgi:guanylate kinase